MSRLFRTLVVDDSPVMVDSLVRLLATVPGLQIVGVAMDGVESVRCATELMPDLIIMDIQMPGMDGFAAAREIRKRFPNLPVLLLSTHAALDGWQDEARAIRACRLVGKSALPSALPDILTDLLQ